MKEIKAYIRSEKLDEVVSALAHVDGLSGISVSTITGFGRGRGRLRLVNFETHKKVEATCSDNLVLSVVSAIEKSARTGQRGDGKIYVSSIEQSTRIEDGSRNEP